MFCISSCEKKNDNYVFKYAISENPLTLDPQCALYDSSESVFSFVFEGLFRFGEDGAIENGIIEDYKISDDAKKWTFYLKTDVYWSDGENFSEKCTADDFVFAFQRLLKPATKSDRAVDYYIIKNAEKINKGQLTDISQLGVHTIDEYTLEIELETPCSDFQTLLSLPPAMPCNEEFFESTQGRYGLASECIASNSGYYVHTWNYDEWSEEGNYIILRRNKLNITSENAPYSINLFIDPVDKRKDFNEEILKVYESENIEEINELKKTCLYSEYNNTVWGFIFNLDSDFSNQDYRIQLANSTHFSSSDYRYTVFNDIIPHSVFLGEESYRVLVGNTKAISDMQARVGALSGKKLVIPQETGLRADIGKVLQDWQSECDFYCSIVELEDNDYQNALKNKEFDIALVKLTGEYNSPYAYFNDFLTGNSANYSGYNNPKYSHIINSAITSSGSESAAVYYKEAEQLLIDSGVFIPLCIETEYIFFKDEIESISYNPFSKSYVIIK